MRIGRDHKLPEIGRIGKNFLVPRGSRVKTDFTEGGALFVPNGLPVKNGAVGE